MGVEATMEAKRPGFRSLEHRLITAGLRSRKTQGRRRTVLDGGHLSLGPVEQNIEECGIA